MPSEGPYFDKREDEDIFNTPQKRFIRHEVWGKYAKKRMKENGLPFVNYLTFPAVECYDIKILKEIELLNVTEIDGRALFNSVGFCEKDPEKFARIQKKLPGARYHKGTYEKLVGAFGDRLPERAQKWFPFDVINLDFTSPLFNKESRDKKKITNSIHRTFQIQNIKNSSFTLFLTLPVREDLNDLNGKIKLEGIVKENLENPNLREFREEFLKKYEVELDSHIFNQIDYCEFLLLSIPKMVMKMGFQENFDTACCERYTYRGDHYDGTGNQTRMVTFVFECEFEGNPDGFSGSTPVETLAEKYPKRVLEYFTSASKAINDFFDANSDIKRKFKDIPY